MKQLIALLLVTCVSNVAFADYAAGVKAYSEKRWSQAYDEFLPLAQNGDSRSQYYIGRMYLDGSGMPQDIEMAVDYFLKAANSNYTVAQATLGFLYAEGIGVEKDKKKAIELYKQAADQGNGDALLNLGVMYYTGDGVTKDVEKAVEYFSKVSPTEKPAVAKYLGDIYLNEAKFKDAQKAYNYYVLAAQSGDIGAYHILGTMYQNGTHMNRDMTEAIKFYSYAASKGYTPSQYALGAIYANADGVERDNSKAHAYLSLAAAKDMKEAITAKKQLEEDMTLTERNKANQAMITIQQEDLAEVASPIADKVPQTVTTQRETKTKTTIRRRRRR